MEKYEGNMKNNEGKMKKCVPLYTWTVALRKVPAPLQGSSGSVTSWGVRNF